MFQILPDGGANAEGPTLYMPNLFSLSGRDFFECTADNGIPDPLTMRVLVDDLRYPNGKPGLLGLEWYIWVAIGGGVLLLIIIIIISVCCYKRSKKQKTPKSSKGYVSFKSLFVVWFAQLFFNLQ